MEETFGYLCRKTILMNCEYFFSPRAAGKKINKKGRSFIPSYSTTNPEFANSKRLPKVSSLVRNKREPTKGYETIVAKGRDVFITPATTLPYFFLFTILFKCNVYIYIYC